MPESIPLARVPSRPFPRLARLGLVGLAFGLLLDLVEHDLVSHASEPTIAGFPVSEHLAHFIVVVGMVLVLVGIVRDGIRSGHRLPKHRSLHDAVR